MITGEELVQMKERAEKATEGPWGNGEQYEQMDPGHYVYSETSGLIVVAEEEGTFRGEDAEFIAHAREDVPRLVAEVERLRAVIYNVADARQYMDAHAFYKNVTIYAREALK